MLTIFIFSHCNKFFHCLQRMLAEAAGGGCCGCENLQDCGWYKFRSMYSVLSRVVKPNCRLSHSYKRADRFGLAIYVYRRAELIGLAEI